MIVDPCEFGALHCTAIAVGPVVKTASVTTWCVIGGSQRRRVREQGGEGVREGGRKRKRMKREASERCTFISTGEL